MTQFKPDSLTFTEPFNSLQSSERTPLTAAQKLKSRLRFACLIVGSGFLCTGCNMTLSEMINTAAGTGEKPAEVVASPSPVSTLTKGKYELIQTNPDNTTKVINEGVVYETLQECNVSRDDWERSATDTANGNGQYFAPKTATGVPTFSCEEILAKATPIIIKPPTR
jgi:hypothetical protein